jgi:hypothetical protein
MAAAHRGSSLDALESEDKIIAGLVSQLRSREHHSVEGRFEYGRSPGAPP